MGIDTRINVLTEKVKQWSKDRGITINGKSTTQMLKLVSEYSEIYEAYFEDDIDLLKDAIGDCTVVLINLNELINKEGNLNHKIDWTKVENKKVDSSILQAKTMMTLGKLADDIGKSYYEKASEKIEIMLGQLNSLAELNEINFVDCLELAYNEIKDRKGFLNENGNFIKSTDPYYEKLYKEFLERQKS